MGSTTDNQSSRLLTGARQTMMSWSKVVESYENIPEIFKSAFEMELGAEGTFPYTVFAPAIAAFGTKTTEKLLCEANDTIYVWENAGGKVSLSAYPLETITDLEVGSILLFSWITIGGLTKAGTAAASTIEYNTTSRRYYAHFINLLRPPPIKTDARQQSAEWAKFDHVGAENYKFMNYAHKSLAEGEKVSHTLWQPKITKPIVKLGWHTFQRTLALTHLLILTDKELILIQDDARSAEKRGERDGGKWRYIALEHIQSVSLQEQAEDLLTLSLTLTPGGRQVDSIFAASQKPEIAQLQEKLKKLIG
ncbi:MAG TPA: hypothetical protein PKM21_06705 [Anaerolineales bacterium]|nr:hypothetical protein [Anaerolineales bacterium]